MGSALRLSVDRRRSLKPDPVGLAWLCWLQYFRTALSQGMMDSSHCHVTADIFASLLLERFIYLSIFFYLLFWMVRGWGQVIMLSVCEGKNSYGVSYKNSYSPKVD